MKRIEGSNVLKDENDRLLQECHVTDCVCVNGRKKRSGKQEIVNELKARKGGIIKALDLDKRKRLRKQQQQRGQRPYDR